MVLALFVGNAAFAGTNPDKKTAEDVWAFASEMEAADGELLEAQIKELSYQEKVKLTEMAIEDVKLAQKAGLSEPSTGLYILAVIAPPIAVGIYTSWGMPTLYNVLWTLLGWLPGVIHAFIVLGR